ncbi:manganese superoxide dismutase [Rhizoctonia solani AG-1 IA]|uniref:Superoxide dismutase n=1 Tax=Thanatephorus cucumeris (strain AG1-IA) TaxID=983506 RepID=L8WHT2_THACA|nr:manganese superoxide dismutase [Rhizoctonia solani AG-1 IA]
MSVRDQRHRCLIARNHHHSAMFALTRTATRIPARRAFAASATALEPHISEEIMTLHHKKHHQTYVNGLNAAEESHAKAPSVKERIALQAALKFNGGGHINHSLFWKNLAPNGSPETKLEDGEFKKAIEKDFGSVDALIKKFNEQTAAIQGSGWGWLKLEIVTTSNQDPLLSHVPIIGVDIWEHAFYLQYKNVKPDVSYAIISPGQMISKIPLQYLKAIWNVINFKEAAKRFQEARTS